MPETVYVLTNEAVEGMVKNGRTTTSMPLPFQCFYAAEVGDSLLVEGKLHRIFSDKLMRNNREFFRADTNCVSLIGRLWRATRHFPSGSTYPVTLTVGINGAKCNPHRSNRLAK